MTPRDNTRLTTLPPHQLRIVVLGCGGVGGVAAAHLVEAGFDVTGVTHNPGIAAAIGERGLTAVLGDSAIHNVRFPAVTEARELEGVAPFDLVLLATPPNCARDAIAAILPHLDEQARIVCLPNGLIEEHLMRELPEARQRIVGGIVAFGATMMDAGKVKRTSAGGLTLGRLEPLSGSDPELDAIERVLSAIGPVQRTNELRGARWSKLAINCAISALGTVGGSTLGSLMRHRFVRRLALETMTEVVEVAHAEGVSLTRVAGTLDLDWLAMSHDERLRGGSPGLVAKHAVLLAVGAKYRAMRSSMLLAIERGREPSVAFLNGEITSRAARLGIETPINAALEDTVNAIARGSRESSLETLRGVYQSTRPVLRRLRLVA